MDFFCTFLQHSSLKGSRNSTTISSCFHLEGAPKGAKGLKNGSCDHGWLLSKVPGGRGGEMEAQLRRWEQRRGAGWQAVESGDGVSAQAGGLLVLQAGKARHIHAVEKESQNKSKDTVTSQSVPDNNQRGRKRASGIDWKHLIPGGKMQPLNREGAKTEVKLAWACGLTGAKTCYHCQPEPLLGWWVLSFGSVSGHLRNRQASVTCVIPWTRSGLWWRLQLCFPPRAPWLPALTRLSNFINSSPTTCLAPAVRDWWRGVSSRGLKVLSTHRKMSWSCMVGNENLDIAMLLKFSHTHH